MNAVMTVDILQDYINDIKKIDISQNLADMIFPFCFSTELWDKYKRFDEETHLIDMNAFQKVKYFDDGNTEGLSAEISNIPDDTGGIYIYVIENPIVPFSGHHIMYVGRAMFTQNQNLRARARTHFYQYKRGEENERLERVFDNWKDYVYLFYLPLSDNEKIDLAERELINTLTPPCNKDDYSPAIRRKLRANFFA